MRATSERCLRAFAPKASHLLLDQARIMESETPLDQAAFARRLSHSLAQALA